VSDQNTQPRCCAIVGAYLSGKTSLFEEILFTTGAIKRKGSVDQGNSVGDNSPEARAHSMSTEINLSTTQYLDQEWTFIDCPGSLDFMQDAFNGAMVCDMAIVVCEPAPDKAIIVSPILKFLDDFAIPHMIFINKMDQTEASVSATLEALQDISTRPLLLREIPIREKGEIIGYVDLVSERAYQWQDGERSKLISMPQSVVQREQEARGELLEGLADFDDHLLEELLEDVQPPKDEIYETMTKDLAEDYIVPVFFGSAEHRGGVTRLLKALHHEAPDVAQTAEHRDIPLKDTCAQVFKIHHAAHAGKQTIVRIWSGILKDGMTLNGERVSGMQQISGHDMIKRQEAQAGQVVILGRLNQTQAGQLLTQDQADKPSKWIEGLVAQYYRAITTQRHEDEVKLPDVLAKLKEEDPSLYTYHDQASGQLLLGGQGDMHIKIALEKLENRFALNVNTDTPNPSYKESIHKPITHHARHRKQSGGHGEFGDVHLKINPLPRGSGFSFSDTISGGAVPKQYIPAVESGIVEYMQQGPLGFPVIDIAVTLTDGSYHAVDSSEMAFKKAAQAAMREAMPQAQPVLLEGIAKVILSIPTQHTPKIQRMITGKRGQILGFDTKEGWKGWDEVTCLMPEVELHDIILELQSITKGVGFYESTFDTYQELIGKQADKVVEDQKRRLEK
jgi:elongation factor G